MQVAGKMLPALGFALLLKQIVAEKWMIVLFLMGWIITQATGMTDDRVNHYGRRRRAAVRYGEI